MELGIKKFTAFNTTENGLKAVIFYTEAPEEELMTFRSFTGKNYPEHAEVTDVTFEEYSGHVVNVIDYLHLLQGELWSKLSLKSSNPRGFSGDSITAKDAELRPSHHRGSRLFRENI